MSATPASPTDAADRFSAAQERLKAANGTAPSAAGHNPYAHDRRVPCSHRVYETMSARLAELSEELRAMGYGPHVASQAELLMMLLHDSMPTDVNEAAQRLAAWGAVKASPPSPRPEPTDG